MAARAVFLCRLFVPPLAEVAVAIELIGIDVPISCANAVAALSLAWNHIRAI
jgi:hypothetical protein